VSTTEPLKLSWNGGSVGAVVPFRIPCRVRLL
jgi:hypothetical protein